MGEKSVSMGEAVNVLPINIIVTYKFKTVKSTEKSYIKGYVQ